MRWELPRELLFATIFSLAIFVAALWPSQYPYSQIPEINPQEQIENGLGGNQSTLETPSSPISTTRKQQAEHRRDSASEVTLLGIKPGEWLLSIVTLMLWLATVRLVTEGKLASEKAIAETRRIGEAQVKAYVDIRDVAVIFVGMPGILNSHQRQDVQPIVRITAKNTGQSPARNFVWNPTIQYFSIGNIGAEPKSKIGELGGNWRELLGAGISVGHEHIDSAMATGMLLLKFLQESDANMNAVLLRLRIQFEFEDVFDRRIVDDGYFYGIFTCNPDRVTQTDFGPSEWSGKLTRMNKPRDWPAA